MQETTTSTQTISLPVVRSRGPAVRRSRTSRWRAVSLVLVHVLIIGHIAHWMVTGRTVSPVEPSEAMYTLNDGELNAGFLFFLAAIVSTMLLGRYVCGWGCHLIAYQDLSAWLLKRVRIKPKAFRSRLLVFAPLALALYMFVWPTVYRRLMGLPQPVVTNHLMKVKFWETFPGPVVAVLTILGCGFVVIYFLGSKGFCTYACPYGGFFALADRVAPGRIRVTDACKHCGHCTATCTSNVRVHEEVALYGMVVDPGCMKCMDCISVCPNDALYFGFGRPRLGATRATRNRPRAYDFSLWEEGLMGVIGVGALLAFRGLYGQIPLLLAMAMAGLTAYLTIKLIRMVRTSNVRLQNLQLVKGGNWTRNGVLFAMATVLVLIVTGHSAVIQYSAWRGSSLARAVSIGDEAWAPGVDWWSSASGGDRSKVQAAIGRLELADRLGFLTTPTVLRDLVPLYLARGQAEDAEQVMNRLLRLMPGVAEFYRAMGALQRKIGATEEAQSALEKALALDPDSKQARLDLVSLFVASGRADAAVEVYRSAWRRSTGDMQLALEYGQFLMRLNRAAEAVAILQSTAAEHRGSADIHAALGVALIGTGRIDEGIAALRQATQLDPDLADAQYNLGMALLQIGSIEDGVRALRKSVLIRPESAQAQYNLAVGTFMAGRPADALPPIREAVRLNPSDPDAFGFLSVVLDELGDPEGAAAARSEALRLSQQRNPSQE